MRQFPLPGLRTALTSSSTRHRRFANREILVGLGYTIDCHGGDVVDVVVVIIVRQTAAPSARRSSDIASFASLIEL
jgi:hypothetical protein